jgi:hypothetical protein
MLGLTCLVDNPALCDIVATGYCLSGLNSNALLDKGMKRFSQA